VENAVPPSSSRGDENAPPSEDREDDVSPGKEALSAHDDGGASPSSPSPAPAPKVPAPTPRPTMTRPATPRPGLTGAILGPPPTNNRVTPAPTTTRTAPTSVPPSIRHSGGAPAAPRSSLSGRGPLITAAPEPPGPARGGVYLSPRMTAIFGGLFGLATVTSVIALLIQVVPPRDERAIVAGTAASGSASAAVASKPPPVSKRPVRVAIPGPWRISELEKDSSIGIETGTMDRKSLLEVLGDKGVPKAQVYRIMKAFDGVRKFEKSGRKERFTVAIEKSSKRVKAFEYEVTPGEIWQSREGQDGLLSPGAKLDMKIAEGEIQGAFYVGGDLPAAIREGGLEDGLLTTIDEALAGHMSSEGFEEGGTVRVIATEETALGLFSRYKRIIAMEYRPADPTAKPTRVYTFNGQEARGYWDDHGKQPNAGGWRKPVPGAPITSHYNPRRMHPILHKIVSHTGTDFGAPTGTPIYAAFRGTILSAGPAGPCGNMVQIQHANGIVTGYCHMSRFANIKAGEQVGTHQLIGYIGTTGRSTGPHLHFYAKKNGVFFDSETLQLDGERSLPGADREGFLAAKAALDKRLEAIPLPEPPAVETPKIAAPAGSGSASAGAAPVADVPGPPGPDGKPTRRAMVVGSPAAMASAAAEPGIHPKSFVEDPGDDDEDPRPPGAALPAGAPTPAPIKGKQPDPAEAEDDEH
jgi:murein DD-endopeptidase MepM/ murein hydrolase activator NlpD